MPCRRGWAMGRGGRRGVCWPLFGITSLVPPLRPYRTPLPFPGTTLTWYLKPHWGRTPKDCNSKCLHACPPQPCLGKQQTKSHPPSTKGKHPITSPSTEDLVYKAENATGKHKKGKFWSTKLFVIFAWKQNKSKTCSTTNFTLVACPWVATNQRPWEGVQKLFFFGFGTP